jgi:hypothetical protein
VRCLFGRLGLRLGRFGGDLGMVMSSVLLVS